MDERWNLFRVRPGMLISLGYQSREVQSLPHLTSVTMSVRTSPFM
jgi:hypothetical protein